MRDTTNIDRYRSRRSVVRAKNGIVATSQPLAAETGVEALRRGGNAFDAAVATAATLCVVEPFSTGIGGDVFAMYRTADGEVGAMRSCGPAPDHVDLQTVREDVSTADTRPTSVPKRHANAVTVPGTVRGWEATIERFGRRSFGQALAPAAEYAEDGYPVSEVIAEKWHEARDVLQGDNARDAFLQDGRAPEAGEMVHLPELGASFRTLADQGADALYDGELGEAIVDEVQERGGHLTRSDLRKFEPEFPDPVSTTYGGAEVFELPPNNQGLIVLETLNMATELGVGGDSPSSVADVHRFIEALKLAFHDGHYHITDPDRHDVPPLADPAYAAERATAVGPKAATDIDIGYPGTSTPEDADTVLLTVADDEGNVVSFINSIFDAFGSGIVARDTGILLQNRGSSFSLDSSHPNRFEPGKRPFHTLIPAVARLDEDDWMAFGVMGGFMQPQGHVQVVSNVLDHDMGIQEALDAPRWRYREDGRLAVESRLDDVLTTGLVRRGHDVMVDEPEQFGGGQIARNRNGSLSGATDPRKDGTVVGY